MYTMQQHYILFFAPNSFYFSKKTYFTEHMKIIFHQISARLSNHEDVIIEANRDFQSLKSTAKSISSPQRLPSESNTEDYSSTHERPQKKVNAGWYRAFRFASGSYERRYHKWFDNS